MFTPLSRFFPCQGEAYHRNISKQRVAAGSLLIYFDRNVSLDFICQIATLAEANGDEQRFRRLMRRAFARAQKLEKGLSVAPQHLFSLANFYCRLLDFSAARRVISTAQPFAQEVSEALKKQVHALEVECAASIPSFDEATNDFYARVGSNTRLNRDNSVIDIFVPANAFSLRPLGYEGFQHDVRRTFRMLMALLDDRKRSYRLRIRLATHGIIENEARPFISYHSVSKGTNGLHIKESDRRSYFSADRCGYSGWSEFATCNVPYVAGIDAAHISKFVEAERAALISGNISKYDQPEKSSVGFSRTYVFVALQVMDDAVQRLAHMHIFDMLEEVCQHCHAIGLEVVVKRHPKCNSAAMSLALKRGARLRKFLVSEASIHDLISEAVAVCTINSSVGAEALLHGKPVYCFGAAEYKQACFEIKRHGSFAKDFRFGELPRPMHEIEAILYALRHDYSVNVRDADQAKTFLDHKLSLVLS